MPPSISFTHCASCFAVVHSKLVRPLRRKYVELVQHLASSEKKVQNRLPPLVAPLHCRPKPYSLHAYTSVTVDHPPVPQTRLHATRGETESTPQLQQYTTRLYKQT